MAAMSGKRTFAGLDQVRFFFCGLGTLVPLGKRGRYLIEVNREPTSTVSTCNRAFVPALVRRRIEEFMRSLADTVCNLGALIMEQTTSVKAPWGATISKFTQTSLFT